MLKNFLAAVGILIVVVGVVVWQFGFLSKQAKEASQKIERATAAARAEKMIETTKENIDKLDERARQYRIEAKTLEIKLDRQEADVVKTEAAMRKLIQAANEAGLPKPGAQDALTDEQRAVKLTFGGKTVGAKQIYETLERWNKDVKMKRAPIDAQRQVIRRMNSAADQLVAKQSKMGEVVVELRGRLEELRISKDLAEVNAQLAEMEANVEDKSVGKIGDVLDVLQSEIDELDATTLVFNNESTEQTETLSPSDVSEPVNVADELDRLWSETLGIDDAESAQTDDEKQINPDDIEIESADSGDESK